MKDLEDNTEIVHGNEEFPKLLAREANNPEYKASWERFAASGKIGDYLDYLKTKERAF